MGLEIFHQALSSVCSSALHVLPLVTKSPRLLPPYSHTGSDQILKGMWLCALCVKWRWQSLGVRLRLCKQYSQYDIVYIITYLTETNIVRFD